MQILTLPTHRSLKHAVPAQIHPGSSPLRMLCGSPDAAAAIPIYLPLGLLPLPLALSAFFAVWQSHRLMDATPAEMIRTTNTNTTTTALGAATAIPTPAPRVRPVPMAPYRTRDDDDDGIVPVGFLNRFVR